MGEIAFGEGFLAGILGERNGIGEPSSSLRAFGSSKLDVIAGELDVVGGFVVSDLIGVIGRDTCSLALCSCF